MTAAVGREPLPVVPVWREKQTEVLHCDCGSVEVPAIAPSAPTPAALCCCGSHSNYCDRYPWHGRFPVANAT
ncbi:hypothetical protein GCM10027427_21790 [Pseudoclavibacter terrae]